jgi:hypothetical protein
VSLALSGLIHLLIAEKYSPLPIPGARFALFFCARGVQLELFKAKIWHVIPINKSLAVVCGFTKAENVLLALKVILKIFTFVSVLRLQLLIFLIFFLSFC